MVEGFFGWTGWTFAWVYLWIIPVDMSAYWEPSVEEFYQKYMGAILEAAHCSLVAFPVNLGKCFIAEVPFALYVRFHGVTSANVPKFGDLVAVDDFSIGCEVTLEASDERPEEMSVSGFMVEEFCLIVGKDI